MQNVASDLISFVCKQNVLKNNDKKNEKHHPTTIKLELRFESPFRLNELINPDLQGEVVYPLLYFWDFIL